VLSSWFDRDVVIDHLSLMALMELGYDEKHDTAYWYADLCVVSIGIVSNAPSVNLGGYDGDESLFDSGRVKVTAIECLSGQMPVCFCYGV
jgi:hypothetical protein